MVQRLTGEGINHAGIKRIIELETAMANMAIEVAKLRVEVDELLVDNPKAAQKSAKVIAPLKKNEVIIFDDKVNP
jgi:MerR family transcriptional regulator/heat shock protein HspR